MLQSSPKNKPHNYPANRPFPSPLLPLNNLLFLPCTHLSPKYKLVLIQERTFPTLCRKNLRRTPYMRRGQFCEVITSLCELRKLPYVRQPVCVKPQVLLVELLPVLLNCVTIGPRIPTSLIPGRNCPHEDDWESSYDQNNLFKSFVTPRTSDWNDLNLNGQILKLLSFNQFLEKKKKPRKKNVIDINNVGRRLVVRQRERAETEHLCPLFLIS